MIKFQIQDEKGEVLSTYQTPNEGVVKVSVDDENWFTEEELKNIINNNFQFSKKPGWLNNESILMNEEHMHVANLINKRYGDNPPKCRQDILDAFYKRQRNPSPESFFIQNDVRPIPCVDSDTSQNGSKGWVNPEEENVFPPKTFSCKNCIKNPCECGEYNYIHNDEFRPTKEEEE